MKTSVRGTNTDGSASRNYTTFPQFSAVNSRAHGLGPPAVTGYYASGTGIKVRITPEFSEPAYCRPEPGSLTNEASAGRP